MDINVSLTTLRNLINDEKKQLDYILKGAELLANMLIGQQQSGNKEKQNLEHSEPPVAPKPEGSEATPLYSTPE